MFLKQDEFTYNGQVITISELSALQRIELLEYLSDQEKADSAFSSDVSEEMQTARIISLTIRSGARVVAMSLWHGDKEGTNVESLQQQILNTWPVEAIGKADSQIKILSGMIALTSSEVETEPAPGDSAESTPETEPVTTEKP